MRGGEVARHSQRASLRHRSSARVSQTHVFLAAWPAWVEAWRRETGAVARRPTRAAANIATTRRERTATAQGVSRSSCEVIAGRAGLQEGVEREIDRGEEKEKARRRAPGPGRRSTNTPAPAPPRPKSLSRHSRRQGLHTLGNDHRQFRWQQQRVLYTSEKVGGERHSGQRRHPEGDARIGYTGEARGEGNKS